MEPDFSEKEIYRMSRIRIIKIVLALAAFPLLGLLARDYILLGYPPQPERQAASAPQEVRAEMAFEEYAPVVEKGVFPGKGKLANIEIREAAGSISEAPLPELKLIGTYTGPRGYAVFSKDGTEGESVFRVGESVFGSGVLRSVSPGRAVVSTGSGEAAYTVFLEKIPEAISAMGKKSAAESGPGKQELAYSRQVTEKDWVIDRGAVESALSDIGRIMTDARLTPRLSNGAVQGFTVTEIKPRGVFDAVGLKDGDVLTSINGYRIDSPEKAVQVLSALKGQTDFDLGVIRQGQPKSFRYSIR